VRLAWLTPDAIASDGIRRWLCIPNTPELIASVTGALLPLTYAENWEAYGTITPDETALAMSLMFEDFVAQESKCMKLIPEPIFLRDQKAQNTNGGTFTAGAWQVRNINVKENDVYGLCSIADNRYTLEGGYRWIVKAKSPCNSVIRHMLRLWSVSDNLVVANGNSGFASGTQDWAHLTTLMLWAAGSTKTFELQHRAQTTVATTGLGVASNLAQEEYTVIELYPIPE